MIVTHHRPTNVPDRGVYTFVNTVEDALAAARDLAGEKDIDVFSANIGTQLLRAGLVDELRIHLVPVLFGAGTRLFDDPTGHLRLIAADVSHEPKATHLRYTVEHD